jgi:hypothetical protein
LFEALIVGLHDGRHIFVDIADQVNFFFKSQLHGNESVYLLDDLGNINIFEDHLELTSLKLSKVQRVVHKREQESR